MAQDGPGTPTNPDEAFSFGPDPTPARASTLAEVLETLGPSVLYPLALPLGADVTIAEPVINDPGQPLADQPGAILLAVGCDVGDDETLALIQEAKTAGFSAVVVKARGADPSAARASAQSLGVALLAAPDDMPWRQIDALLTATSSANGQVRDTYASVGPADLFALANAIAFSVGGATTIEDTRGHVLAYSNLPHHEIDEIRRRGILGRQTPERPTNLEEYALVFKSEGPYRFYPEQPGHMDRLVMAVRAGAQLLGVIWVLDGAPPLGPNAEAAIEEAARVTALHLLRARGQSDTDRWQRGETLTALLSGSVTGQAAAERLRIPFDIPTTVIALARSEPSTTAGLEAARTVDLVNVYCEAWHHNALCAPAGGVIYALLPTLSGEQVERRLRRFGEDLAAVVERSTAQPVHVAIGPRAETLDDVPRGRQAADRVLRALGQGPPVSRVASVDDVRSRVILLEIAEQNVTTVRLANNPVTMIHEYDLDNSTSYASTLLTYLDTFGDVSGAAARLSIHENTLRYRVRRAQELFDIELDDPDSRLVLWLQLKLRDLGH